MEFKTKNIKAIFPEYLCTIIGLILLLFNCSISHAQNKDKPNVILIFADDLGWGDLGSYGHNQLKTPALDKLAKEGKLFTQFYVNSPVCSPSRASLMTGRFPAELGIHGHLSTPESNSSRGMPNYLNPEIHTITKMFKDNGYAVGHFGKWHLGHSLDAPLPNAYGIDEAKTNTSNSTDNFKLWHPDNRPIATKLILDETINFINRNKDKPFYVNAWLVDPHAVLNPTEKQMEMYEHVSPKPYAKKYYGKEVKFHGAPQVYYATVTEMDRQIGIFLDKLEALGRADNTIVIFTSDNGPEVMQISNAAHSAAGSPGPFRGFKRSLYEGGIRVPLIVRWPKHINENTIDSTSVISAVDFIPTLNSLCGFNTNINLDLDGEDMSNSLLISPKKRIKPLFWEWRFGIVGRPIDKSPMLVMRQNQWKLLMNPDKSRIELYDIIKDPSELENKILDEPEIVDRMSKKLLSWKSKLPYGLEDKNAGSNSYKWPKVSN
ncbi:UNVERIFIED_CONTAM: hypothetical protein GTU68_019176 [Idotea baltica]|nr:hypothetical protein [Idotea baltica]